MSSASKSSPRISSPFFVSTVTTEPSASCSRTMGMPTRLFPTTDILACLVLWVFYGIYIIYLFMHTVYEQQEGTIRVVRVIPLIRFVVTYCIGHQDPSSFAISR